MKLSLIRWQMRQLAAVNIIMLLIAVVYTTLRHEPFVPPGTWWMFVGVLIHSGIIVWQTGQLRSRRTGFLHAQGWTRDQLWSATIAATGLSALLICGAVWLIMITGLRAVVQDALQNPWFPFMAATEVWTPVCLVCEYAVLIPAMHYVWIRASQSARDAAAGWILMTLVLVFAAWEFELAIPHSRNPSFLAAVGLSFVPLVVCFLVACRRLHRDVEVRS